MRRTKIRYMLNRWLVVGKVCSKNVTNWYSVSFPLSSKLPLQVLQTLGTETYRPSSASQCVAGIACAEIPVSQWPELIPQLVANVTNPNSTEHMKESTLEAIGYICQDIVSISYCFWLTCFDSFSCHMSSAGILYQKMKHQAAVVLNLLWTS